MIERLGKLAARGVHPPADVLSRYLDGELTSKRRLALEAHLHECPGCRRELQALSEMVRALGSLRVDGRPGLADSILTALRAESAPAPEVSHRSSRRLGSPPLTVVTDASRRPSIGRRGLASARARGWRIVRDCLRRPRLRITLPVALLVGTAVSLINQSAMIFSDRITVGMCAICGLNFVLPFIALNIVLAMATRLPRRRRF